MHLTVKKKDIMIECINQLGRAVYLCYPQSKTINVLRTLLDKYMDTYSDVEDARSTRSIVGTDLSSQEVEACLRCQREVSWRTHVEAHALCYDVHVKKASKV